MMPEFKNDKIIRFKMMTIQLYYKNGFVIFRILQCHSYIIFISFNMPTILTKKLLLLLIKSDLKRLSLILELS